jgi:hypothetical protein
VADAKIKFIVDLVDKFSGDAKKINKELDKMDDTTKKAKKGWNMLAGAITVAGVAAAGSKIFKLGKEGADLERTREKFDRLTASIGTTSEALMTDMQEATQGLKSDAELASLATDLLSLGLAKSHDEAVRMSNVAGQLNMDMNQLVLTLTNMTTMRFDALGVSVDGFKEKVAELEDQGMSTNEAFTEAFLQQAEKQLDLVGSAAGTNAGKIQKMEAELANLADTVKLKLAPVIADLAENISKNINVTESQVDASRMLNDMLKTGIITQEQYNDALVDTTHSGRKIVDLDLANQYAKEYQQILLLFDATDAMHPGMEQLEDEQRRLAESSEILNEGYRGQVELLGSINTGLYNTIQGYKDQLKWIEAGGLAIQATADQAMQDYLDGIISAEEAQAIFNESAVQSKFIMDDLDGQSMGQIAQTIATDLNIPLGEAFALAMGTKLQMEEIDGMVSRAEIIVTKTTVSSSGSQKMGGGGPGKIDIPDLGGAQAGISFIVPPTLTNDSGMLRVNAGERVNVSSRSKTQADMAGQLFGGDVEELAEAIALSFERRGAFDL